MQLNICICNTLFYTEIYNRLYFFFKELLFVQLCIEKNIWLKQGKILCLIIVLIKIYLKKACLYAFLFVLDALHLQSRYDFYVHDKVSLASFVSCLYICLIDTVCQNRFNAEKQIPVFDINMKKKKWYSRLISLSVFLSENNNGNEVLSPIILTSLKTFVDLSF